MCSIWEPQQGQQYRAGRAAPRKISTVFGCGTGQPEPITTGSRNRFHANPQNNTDTGEVEEHDDSAVVVTVGGKR
jgi:hypothetical protein